MKRNILLILALVAVFFTLVVISDDTGATGTKAGFETNDITVQTGQTFYLTMVINDIDDLYAWKCDIEYDADYMELTNVTEGQFLSSDGAQTYYVAPALVADDTQWTASTRLAQDEGVDGSGDVVTLFFRALDETNGKSVRLKNIELIDRNARDIDRDILNSGRCIVTIEDDAPLYTQPEN